MNKKTIILLSQAKEICDKKEMSTEYMIQYMQDYVNVSFECVIEYLKSLSNS